jgi:segregation and condensation protein B
VSNDERPESLAAQAAAWVPPWERQPPPDRAYQAAHRIDDERPEDDEDRSGAGLSDDDDDFDEEFEGPNPAGYDGTEVEPPSESGSPSEAPSEAPSELAPFPGEADGPVTVDAPQEIEGDEAREPTDIGLGAEVPLPDAVIPDSDDDEAAALAADDEPFTDEDAGSDRPVASANGRPGAQPPTSGDAAPIDSGGRAEAGSGVPAQGRMKRNVRAAAVPAGERTAAEVDLPVLDDAELAAALEAILLVVDEPVAEMQLAQILEQPTERVAVMLEDISARYTAAGHGFDLRRAAGGWRLYTRPEYAAYVERFVLDGQSVRLTQAALETLAVVAYKQPVTRSRISAIRGVNCDGVMRTLVTRGLIEECGTEGETGAYLYRTTALFLEKLGLNSVDQLPPLAPFLPDDVEEVLDATG